MGDERRNADLHEFAQLLGAAIFVDVVADDDGVDPGRVEQRFPMVDGAAGQSQGGEVGGKASGLGFDAGDQLIAIGRRRWSERSRAFAGRHPKMANFMLRRGCEKRIEPSPG